VADGDDDKDEEGKLKYGRFEAFTVSICAKIFLRDQP
jgi:hypothetical protein